LVATSGAIRTVEFGEGVLSHSRQIISETARTNTSSERAADVSFIAMSDSEAARIVILLESVNSYAGPNIDSGSTRVIDLREELSSYIISINSTSSRYNTGYNRDTTSLSDAVDSSSLRIVDLLESVGSDTLPILTSSVSQSDYSRSPTKSWTKNITSSSMRNLDLLKLTNSYSKPWRTFTFTERRSLELVDYTVTWDEESLVWYTPWVSEEKILGSEDRFVLRAITTDDAKEPTARITIQYDENGNGKPTEESETIAVAKDERVYEVEEIPVSEDGWYRMKIAEYSGYNSLTSLNMGIVH